MTANDEARLVRLAGVVDYKVSKSDEPVLIKLANNIFVQYNRLKEFNSGTGDSWDSLAITQQVNGHSQFLATLRPGESYSHGSTSIQACERVTSSSGGADVMLVSIGTGAPVCDQAHTVSIVSSSAPELNPQLTDASEGTPFPHTEAMATPTPVVPDVPVEAFSEPADTETTPFPTAAPVPSAPGQRSSDNSDPPDEQPFHHSFDHSQWWQKFWKSLFH